MQRIKQLGPSIVLASSAKGEELAGYKRTAGILDLVDEETSSDDAEKSKPHLDIFQAALGRLGGDVRPEEVIVIGDLPYDAEAARKLALRTIGVLSEGFAEHDLRQAGCLAVYRDPSGPQGPMQVRRQQHWMWAVGIGSTSRRIALNGRAYLARLYGRYKNWPDAIAAYNSKPG